MTGSTSPLTMILNGGRVSRFHTKSILKEESVAEHSFLVAWIATLVVSHGGLLIRPSAGLLLACLAHDLPEYVLGDMPSPAKKFFPGLRDKFREEETNLFALAGMPDYESGLSAGEMAVVSFADNFAGYLKCVYERQMGNCLLDNTIMRYKEYIAAMLASSDHLPVEYCKSLMREVELAPFSPGAHQ